MCVLNVVFMLGSEFFVEVGWVLVFDVFDDRVLVFVVVDEVVIVGGIDNVEFEVDVVFFDDVWNGLDFGGGVNGFVRE